MADEDPVIDLGLTSDPVAPDDILAGATVVLRDGAEVAIVPMQATDSARLMRFHRTLSQETTYMRFFFFHPELSERETHHFTHVDHRNREALVAVADDEIVAVARFDRLEGTGEAEVAFVVADSWQGRGIGSLLFDRLAELARECDVTRFVADTLSANKHMLAVFHHAGLPVEERVSDGVVHLVLELGPASGSAEGRCD